MPTRRPLMRLAYSDAGAGVDLATLVVGVDGSGVPFDCMKSATDASCVPAVDLPVGALVARATIRDLQGNLSAEAVRSFAITAPVTTTTFVARLLLADGSPAVGGELRLEQDAERWAVAAADGAVELASVELLEPGAVNLHARYTRPNTNFTAIAFVAAAAPVLGGVTDLGTLVLEADCDSYFEPVGWRGVEADLEWAPTATAVFDDGSGPALYVAGKFNYSDSGPVGRIARDAHRLAGRRRRGDLQHPAGDPVARRLRRRHRCGALCRREVHLGGVVHRPTIWRSGTESAGARWVAVSTDWSAASR